MVCLATVLVPRSAVAFCDEWCTPTLVDDNCGPSQDALVPGQRVKLAIACQRECKRPSLPITTREPRPEDIPRELRQLDCRHPRPVTMRRTEVTCDQGKVYELTAPPPGRYAVMQELLLEVTGHEVCPHGPAEPSPAPKTRLSGWEEQRRRGERLLAEAEVSDWDRVKKDWSAEISNAGVVILTQQDGEPSAFVGGELRVGFRHTDRFDRGSGSGGKGFSITPSKNMRWCMPVLMCGMLGMIWAPPSSFMGNELGLDLVARLGRTYQAGDDALGWSVGLRPFFRVAADDRLRSQSLLGSVLPELGVEFASTEPSALYARWHLYPIEVLVHPSLALSWDGPIAGLVIPLDGSPVAPTMGTGISITGLIDPDD